MEDIKLSLELFKNTYKGRVKIDLIIKRIKKDLIDLLGNMGILVAISDNEGNIKYIDQDLEKYYKYIVKFCKNNLDFLEIGTFSIPLADLIFFRVSERVVVILSAKGPSIKPLVTFVSKMDKYKAILNRVIDKIRTVNYWDTHTTSEIIFKAFQEEMQIKEINKLFKEVEIYLNKFEFKKTIEILSIIKESYRKIDEHSMTASFIDKLIKKIEVRLKSKI
ncbi:MAG: hypothetical protein ACTSO9_21435 [Candidatus Helarchaeota archaeon]